MKLRLSLGAATYGTRVAKIKLPLQLQRLVRVDFTLRLAIAAVVLLVLFSYAIIDFVSTASRKEYQIQESALRGELGQFLLNTREPDGSSLLENPEEFTKAKRPAQIVTVRRPFFTYFLTKENFRAFRTNNLRFEPPRACVLEFLSTTSPPRINRPSFPLQACFAVIPSDPAGRYVYFTLRYPTASILRHIPGHPVADSDRLILRFLGKKEVRIVLTYQQVPWLKRKGRHVSSTDRLDGFHEIAAYLPDEGGHPTRLLNAQAFEQTDLNDNKNWVTIMGRIDTLLLPVEDYRGDWPSLAAKALKIGVEVLPSTNNPSHSEQPVHGFGPGENGTAQLSLEQAYRLAAPSKATLAVTVREGYETGKVQWTSSSLEAPEPQRQQGWFQSAANRVARLMVSGVEKVSVTQDHNLSGLPPLEATLTEDVNIVPDIAARSLAWQFAALFVIAALIWLLWGGFRRLERLTRTAYIAAVSRSGNFAEYADSTDQIGTLGRVLHLLFMRDRQRMARQRRRLERESQQKAEAIQKERELLEARREILQAIGHEIRSPLANLLASQRQDPAVHRNLSRMERAVNALQEAATIEEGLMNGVIAPRIDDLGTFVAKFTDNLADSGKPIVGYGEPAGVLAYFDDIMLETILDHLFDNAQRHASPDTKIEVRWANDGDQVTIEVFNRGNSLEDCESIFKLGVSDPENGGHLGLGLYAARMYLFGMRGSILAENRRDGVAFVVRLQKTG